MKQTTFSISMSAHLLARLDFEFLEIETGKPKYGARSRLIAELVEGWLDEKQLLFTKRQRRIDELASVGESNA